MARLDKAKFEAAFSRSKAKLETGDAPSEQDPQVQELWTLLEPALEEKGRFDDEVRQHYVHVGDHLSECTNDIVSWRQSRGFAVGFAVAIVALIALLLACALFWPDSRLSIQNLGSDSVRISFIGGCFAILFGLPALILRGAFSNAKKEESDALLPESARLVLESVKDLIKK